MECKSILVRWILASAVGACVGSGLASCTGFPKDLKTPVIVLACVVKGGAWAAPSAPAGPAGYVSQMMNDVNAIWKDANFGFVFLADPRVIDDPQPPGMALDVPPYQAKGELGDVRVDDDRGYGSDEAQAAVEACQAAWESEFPASPQPGFTMVFVRELIWTSGGPTPHGGYATPLYVNYTGDGMTNLCRQPYQVTQADVAGRWAIIETYDRNHNGPPPDLEAIVAHELGHNLLLGHGDGLDNDGNGIWDEFCDPTEIDSGKSLMDREGTIAKAMTSLQREKAEAAAAVVPK